jgi:phage regulator Rha-like protein
MAVYQSSKEIAMKNHSNTTSKQSSILNCLTAASKIDQSKRMTSKEIAELTGKRHDHVMRDVKSLISQDAICAPNFGETSIEVPMPRGGFRKESMYSLDFHATMTLITGYNAKLRSAVIARWIELEEETLELEPKKENKTPKKTPQHHTSTKYPTKSFHYRQTGTDINVVTDTDGTSLFNPHEIFKAIGYRNTFTAYRWMVPHIERMQLRYIDNDHKSPGDLFLTKDGLNRVIRDAGHRNKFIFWSWLEETLYPQLNDTPQPQVSHPPAPRQFLISFDEKLQPVITPLVAYEDMTVTWNFHQDKPTAQVTGYFKVDQIPEPIRNQAIIAR